MSQKSSSSSESNCTGSEDAFLAAGIFGALEGARVGTRARGGTVARARVGCSLPTCRKKKQSLFGGGRTGSPGAGMGALMGFLSPNPASPCPSTIHTYHRPEQVHTCTSQGVACSGRKGIQQRHWVSNMRLPSIISTLLVCLVLGLDPCHHLHTG